MWEQCRDVSTDTQGCRDESMQDVGMCTYKDAGMLRAPSGVTSPQCHTRGEGGKKLLLVELHFAPHHLQLRDGALPLLHQHFLQLPAMLRISPYGAEAQGKHSGGRGGCGVGLHGAGIRIVLLGNSGMWSSDCSTAFLLL